MIENQNKENVVASEAPSTLLPVAVCPYFFQAAPWVNDSSAICKYKITLKKPDSDCPVDGEREKCEYFDIRKIARPKFV